MKTILLTLLTLSVLTIAMIEVSGISEKRISNMFGTSDNTEDQHATEHGAEPIDPNAEQNERDAKMRSMAKTEILVKETKHNFGSIKEGEKVRHTYTVENVGTEPLFISNVQVSCGCTVPAYPKDLIAPGQSGDVTLEFNSEGKPGSQEKSALIQANAVNAPYSVSFKAEVEPSGK